VSSLTLDGVWKRFGGIEAVANVSMAATAGTITGLIGPNGAGKTTLVNLITGILKLSSGQIRLGNMDISEAPPHQVARAGISRTFQNIRLLPEATVLDNVVIGFHRHERSPQIAQILGLRRSRKETRALKERGHALLARFNMERFANYPAGALAYGHQRRVEMMRAVATDPKVLLLDEPVAGMNDVEAGALGEIFQALAAEGICLLLIEHNVRFVAGLSQKIYVLDSGKMIASGEPAEVLNNPMVITAYLGRE
jgi:branched-chain amino acid transport system ATP-binding protein